MSTVADLPPFESFPRIPRLRREIVITEKIDGTNGVIALLPDERLLMGSRNGWITDGKDPFGFARWVTEHEDELRKGLGYGTHYGEWWGSGIQRRYGLKEKRFSLFNTGRWTEDTKPACCHVVPILYRGIFSTDAVASCLQQLRELGSLAVPGFMKPEGVIIYHVAAGVYFKQTLDKDDEPKGAT